MTGIEWPLRWKLQVLFWSIHASYLVLHGMYVSPSLALSWNINTPSLTFYPIDVNYYGSIETAVACTAQIGLLNFYIDFGFVM
jgi:hypothetical protein